MSYSALMGAFKGPGLGKGPMPEGELEQGGVAGIARAGGAALQGAGAGLMTMGTPRMAAAMGAQNKATDGAYSEMLHGQQEQDRRAKRHSDAMSILGGLAARSQLLKGNENRTGTEIPQPGM